MTDWEDFGVRWTVRVALALYLAALVIRWKGPDRSHGLARLAWTAGYIAFLLHLAAAFQFVHGWSHDAAYEETARRTYESLGFAFGGGVYVNDAFALIWGLDVGWWWMQPTGYLHRPRWIEWAVQGFLGFIAFNATAVFGHGTIRWVGWGALLILAVALVSRRRD